MFGLDAELVTPTLATTFTTRDRVEIRVLGEALAQTTRRVRAELAPAAKYGGTLEWTTGRTEYSGGRRRPHLHLLWKHIDECRADDVHEIGRDVWKRLTGAHSHTAEAIRTPGAAIRYIALHHLKEGQSPPLGFSGRRLYSSMGWWEAGAAETRARARAIVAEERLRRKVERELLEQVPEGLPEYLFDELLESRTEARRVDRGRVTIVRVKEIEELDPTTGILSRRLREVLGDV